MDSSPQTLSLWDLAKPIVRFKWLFSLVFAFFLLAGIVSMQKPLVYFFSSRFIANPALWTPDQSKKIKIELTSLLTASKNTETSINLPYVVVNSSGTQKNFQHFEDVMYALPNKLTSSLIQSTVRLLPSINQDTLITDKLLLLKSKRRIVSEKLHRYFLLQKSTQHMSMADRLSFANQIASTQLQLVDLQDEINETNISLRNNHHDPLIFTIDQPPTAQLLTQQTTRSQTFLIFLIEGICFALIICNILDSIFKKN